jgi:hexosaminidase
MNGKMQLLLLMLLGCVCGVVVGDCQGARYLDPIPAPKPTDVLFPLPSQSSFGSDTLSLSSSSFTITSVGAKSAILDRAIARYHNIIFYATQQQQQQQHHQQQTTISTKKRIVKHKASPSHNVALAALAGLDVTLASGDETLQYGVDESYKLAVSAPRAQLTSNTVYGALRGLESFSQLVSSTSNGTLVINNAPWTITDTPRYAHRGLLIDTSRHYLPVHAILRTIDALAYTKMNVLHWHMVDAQSFPIESDSFPLLTNARYNDEEIYTKNELRTIVQYAKDRGVRVIAEVDTPGHTASWGIGYPEITVCRDKTREQGFCAENPCGMLDVSKNRTYEIVGGFIGEMTEIFPDQFFHFGADEVVLECWDTPAIKAWMNDNKIADLNGALNYFEQQIYNLAKSKNRQPVHWQEVFEEKLTLPSNAIIQVWKDFETLDSVVKAGYRAILSNYQAWYLDCGFGNWCPYCSWIDMYNNEPLQGSTLTPEQQRLILGGEVAIWAELVDEWNLDSRVWPRAAAAGERLWSNAQVKDIPDAFARLLRHSCRLSARGIHADPLIPGSTTRGHCASLQM